MPVSSPRAALATSTEVHRDVSAGGLRLRTTEWSSGTVPEGREPIIALPGALAPRLSFRRLALELESQFRFIAVDFPGFGESEKPPPQRFPYGAAHFAEVMLDLFAGLGIPRAHVLGHGLGGSVAIHLAARHPELVRRLALLAPHVGRGAAQSRLQRVVSPLVGGLVFRQIVGRSLFSTFYKERIFTQVSAEELNDYYEAFTPPAARAALLATLRGSSDPRNVIADLRRIRAPQLIVWGHDDRLTPIEEGRFLSREMPSAGLEIVESGHAPHEERPDVVAPILAKFFLGHRAGSG